MRRRNLELQHSKKRQPPREPSEFDGIDRSVAPAGQWLTGPLGVSADEETTSNWTHKDEAFFINPKQLEKLIKMMEDEKPKSRVLAPGALTFIAKPRAAPSRFNLRWDNLLLKPLVPMPSILTLEVSEKETLDRMQRYLNFPANDHVDALKHAMESVRRGALLDLIKEKL